MTSFFKNCFQFTESCIKHAKYLLDDYKKYKLEQIEDEINRNKRDQEISDGLHQTYENWLKKRNKLLEEGFKFDEEKGIYYFKVTVKHNNKSKTFSCKDTDRDICKSLAYLTLSEACSYMLFGSKIK